MKDIRKHKGLQKGHDAIGALDLKRITPIRSLCGTAVAQINNVLDCSPKALGVPTTGALLPVSENRDPCGSQFKDPLIQGHKTETLMCSALREQSDFVSVSLDASFRNSQPLEGPKAPITQ